MFLFAYFTVRIFKHINDIRDMVNLREDATTILERILNNDYQPNIQEIEMLQYKKQKSFHPYQIISSKQKAKKLSPLPNGDVFCINMIKKVKLKKFGRMVWMKKKSVCFLKLLSSKFSQIQTKKS